tara:strand:+ start:46 stop:777 length:732 start_codon:yes stop_codon:yes gene_type:complete
MIKDLLTSLKMFGAIEILESLVEIKDREAFVVQLLQSEIHHREKRAAKRRLSSAKFPVDKEWSDIDPSLNTGVEFDAVRELGDGSFIEARQNLCLMGQQGTGKTHSLIALGRELCRKGYSVRFYTACELVNILEEAKVQLTLKKVMQGLLKPSLLAIDELGFVPFSESGARLLFDVFASRYERGSIAVTSNLSLNKWIQLFGSEELTCALLDRFTHNAQLFTYEGESVRFKQAKERNSYGRKK